MTENQFALASLISLQSSSGTGFMYSSRIRTYFVTAKHVLFDESGKLRSKEIEIVIQSSKIVDESVFRFRLDLGKVSILKSKVADVVAIIIGNISFDQSKAGGKIGYLDGVETLEQGRSVAVTVQANNVCPIRDITIAGEVIVSGYPTSLGMQENFQFDYNKPLLRKGIVANINFPSRTIILDCPVYAGNSGAPVMQIIRTDFKRSMKIIGVISQYIPFVQNWKNDREKLVHTEYLNSGYSVAVSFDCVLDLVNLHEKDISLTKNENESLL